MNLALIIGNDGVKLKNSVSTDHVHFTGRISETKKFTCLKNSRVFAMSSHYESWGIVVGEALVCGTPVVAYDLDCFKTIFNADTTNNIDFIPCFNTNNWIHTIKQKVLNLRKGLQINYTNTTLNLPTWNESKQKLKELITYG